MTHIMIDLETVSLEQNAAILSIGACKFNEAGVYEHMHIGVDVESCFNVGLVDSADTMYWWSQQSEEARDAAFCGGHTIYDALAMLTAFITEEGEIAYIWGNGMLTDNLWLMNAYKACEMSTPWTYKQDRCFRTAMQMLKITEWVQPEVAHNAVHDAIAQAATLIKAHKQYGVPL